MYDFICITSYIQTSRFQKRHYEILKEQVESRAKVVERLNVQSELKHINDNIIGWIKIPGTRVDYPLLQVKDNTYYLNHSFDKTPNRAGSIYVDYRNNSDMQDDNTIIYGHNMKDGTMFHDLKKFREQEFINKNNIIYVNQNDDTLIYEIFAVYVADPEFEYRKPIYDNAAEFEAFLNKVAALSSVETNQTVTGKDKILTLSTCENNGKRLVVHAKRMD